MKKVIGRRDKADFPELGLFSIAIKIDSGAYTSSIHCKNIHEENNQLICRFSDPKHSKYDKNEYVFKDFSRKQVKSSNGKVQNRYVVKTKIKLFNKIYTIHLTLTDRSDMKFPVLIGRKFLNKKFVIDPQLINLSFNNSTKK